MLDTWNSYILGYFGIYMNIDSIETRLADLVLHDTVKPRFKTTPKLRPLHY